MKSYLTLEMSYFFSSPRPDWPKLKKSERGKACLASAKEGDVEETKPLTGREFVEGKKTCDLYPIHVNLPKRFNNPEWFKVSPEEGQCMMETL